MKTGIGRSDTLQRPVLLVMLTAGEVQTLLDNPEMTVTATLDPFSQAPIPVGDPMVDGLELIITGATAEALQAAGVRIFDDKTEG